MHIQKYFSERKLLSRREAESYLRQGKIKINGQIVTNPAVQIDPDKDVVEIVGTIDKLTVLFHKPRGVISSKGKAEGTTIFDLVPQFQHLNTIGRLDKESEGIILLSNDGVLTNIITGSDHLIEKEYLVEVGEKLTPTKIKALEQGMILEDGPTLPAQAHLVNDHTFSITLKEGRNHQVRRMANKIHLSVLKLRRVRIGHLTIKGVAVGQYKVLKDTDIKQFKAVI